MLVTLKRDMFRIAVNIRRVVFPSPARAAQSGRPLRDWDLWGPFFFIVFLALILSSSASENKVSIHWKVLQAECLQCLMTYES